MNRIHPISVRPTMKIGAAAVLALSALWIVNCGQEPPTPLPVESVKQAVVSGTTTPSPTASWNSSPGTTDLSASSGFWADPQVAASSSHVIVTMRAALGFYTRQGTFISSQTADNLFAGMLPAGSQGAFDLRCLYDEYRRRFWVAALVNSTTSGQARLLVAVSRTEDPRQGFFRYWFGQPSGTGAPTGSLDYPSIGIGADTFYMSENVGSRAVLHVFPADQMAQGVAGGSLTGTWVWWDLRNPDGTFVGLIQPAVNHGAVSSSFNYAVARQGNNKVTVLRISNAIRSNRLIEARSVTFSNAWQNPPDAAQASSTKVVRFSNLGTDALKAVSRGNNLYFVTQDAGTFGTTSNLAAIRLVQLNVSNFASIGITKNRTFGGASASDPAGSTFGYGWPALEVNNAGDIVIVGARSGPSIFPQVRYWVWATNDTDIRSSALLMGSDTPYTNTHCGQWCSINNVNYDLAGASLDPDGTSIWIANQISASTKSQGFSTQVGKVLGSNVCSHDLCSAGGTLVSSCDSCTASICNADPFCCNNSWDAICVGEVTSICGRTCP
jgi:hypothetical protein